MKAVSIIPARGGSKRLPRKNIADFLGQPIIAYTVQAALESALFERVLVSTEDPEIADVAHRYGAEVVVRPVELAGDDAKVNDVCAHLLDREEAEGKIYDVFACFMATAPMRNAEDIRKVFQLIEPGRCEFAMAVTHYDLSPRQALIKGLNGELTPMWPELVNMRSQELPELVVDNGSTYVAMVSAFKKFHTFYGPSLRGYVMPRERSVDINNLTDLELARYLAQRPRY